MVMRMLIRWVASGPKVVNTLMLIHLGTILLWVCVLAHLDWGRSLVLDHLVLHTSWADLLRAPWVLLTYSFTHVGTGFLEWTTMAIVLQWTYLMARQMEEAYGSHALLGFYILVSIGSALFSVAVYPLFSSHVLMVHGASGVLLGLVTGMVVWQPKIRIDLLPNRPVRLVYVLLGLIIAEAVICALYFNSAPPPFPLHLGGIVAGLLVAVVESRGGEVLVWAQWFAKPRVDTVESLLVRAENRVFSLPTPSPEVHPVANARPLPPEVAPRTLTEDDLDRILEKISAQGLDSLTRQERAVLESFSRSR